MLCLTRKPGELVDIDMGGETLTVGLVRIDGHKVRLSFTGPMSIKVRRREISLAIARGQKKKEPARLPT